jgi:hypothetical protein
VDDNIAIAWAYEDSIHELIACGNLTFRFVAAVVESAAVIAGEPSSVPNVLEYADGVYTFDGTGVRMLLTPRYGRNTPGGTKGESVGVDLFDPDSWLVRADATNSGDDVIVTFDRVGPLAPLLGHGADPKSPLTLTPADFLGAAQYLAGLDVDTDIDIEETRAPEVDFTWHVIDGGGFVDDLLVGRVMDLSKLDGASGERTALKQTQNTSTWNVDYVDDGGSGALDGIVATDISGPIDFHVEYLYLPVDPNPTVTMTCK